MRILYLGGIKIVHDAVRNDRVSSNVSLLDFDIVIWDPSTLPSEYPKARGSGGNYLDGSSMIYDIERRLYELNQFINHGRTFVLILPKPWSASVWRGDAIMSSEKTFHIYEHLPFNGLKPFPADGENIELRAGEPFNIYWKRMSQFHRYTAYLESKFGNPFLFLKGTDKIVATFIKNDFGFSLILPTLNNPTRTQQGYSEMCNTFIDSLIELINNLKSLDGDTPLPEWASLYLLPREDASRKRLEEIKQERDEIIQRLHNQEKELLEFDNKRVLIAGTGKALERQIMNIFKDLRLQVIPGQSQRNDLFISYGDKVAEVEVKGVKRGATEEHARQLEAWVSDYFLKNQRVCKGILIVNAFCDTPLEQRSEPAFPYPVKTFSERREHCLMTTTQLLGLYLRCVSCPEEKDQLINEMFETVGIYPKFNDFTSFLSTKSIS